MNVLGNTLKNGYGGSIALMTLNCPSWNGNTPVQWHKLPTSQANSISVTITSGLTAGVTFEFRPEASYGSGGREETFRYRIHKDHHLEPQKMDEDDIYKVGRNEEAYQIRVDHRNDLRAILEAEVVPFWTPRFVMELQLQLALREIGHHLQLAEKAKLHEHKAKEWRQTADDLRTALNQVVLQQAGLEKVDGALQS